VSIPAILAGGMTAFEGTMFYSELISLTNKALLAKDGVGIAVVSAVVISALSTLAITTTENIHDQFFSDDFPKDIPNQI